ncbi:Carboxypeptidase Q, partial [Dissostichus eleginoides]
SFKAILTPQSLLVLDFRGFGLERWLVVELAPQLASQSHSLPFEFTALEAILQHKVNTLHAQLNDVEPVLLDTLESLVDPKILSVDRSKLHILLQNSKSLSELETDIKVFKDTLLKILDEEEIIEELCLTKWTDPRVFEESSLGIDHAEEMELLLENYYMQAEELANKTRELKGLIDDSESVVFINLDSHRNVMMRLNLQLAMGSFSLSLFGLIGVAFGMNLESSFEEDPRVFWLVTGFMFLGSGLIWRRLLSFLGRHLMPSVPPLLLVSSQTPFSTTEDMYLEGRMSGDLPIDDEDGEDGSGSGSGDYDKEEMIRRFLHFSETTISKEMVPTRPQPTSDSPHRPSLTAADSQDATTEEKDTETTPFTSSNGDKSPTADWLTQMTSSTNMPTTKNTDTEFGMDITVIKDISKDDSLGSLDDSATKNRENKVLIVQDEDDIVPNNGQGSRMYDMENPEEVTSENMWERTEVLAGSDLAAEVAGYADVAKQIIDLAVFGAAQNRSYRRLADFTDTIGNRVSGSQNLEMAIKYMYNAMTQDGLDVYLEPVKIPHWVRGKESAEMIAPRAKRLAILGLGSSVGTPPEGIKAEVLVVQSFDELKQRASEAIGRIVVFNQPFVSYGETVAYRAYGASEAAKVGAVATLIRSITPFSINSPHTGLQDYQDGVKRIPSACITVEDAELMWRMAQRGQRIVVRLTMGAKTLPDAESFNTVAEIPGWEHPEQVVLLSGHLDSWDVGQGAMDDGGGAMISWEALSLIKELGLRPRRTLRAVLWTAEEQGGVGAQQYFDLHKVNMSNFDLVMESDLGTFTPEALQFTGSDAARKVMAEVVKLLAPINTTKLEAHGEGTDISPWLKAGVPASLKFILLNLK